MLTLHAGSLALAVFGAVMWSLQSKQRRGGAEPSELYNTYRVARSEGLSQLPVDYSKLPAALPPAVPQLGPPLPGGLGGPIFKAEQRAQGFGQPQTGNNSAETERLVRLKEAEARSVDFVLKGLDASLRKGSRNCGFDEALRPRRKLA